MDELQLQIYQWTQLDKQLKKINKHASDIRKKKRGVTRKYMSINPRK